MRTSGGICIVASACPAKSPRNNAGIADAIAAARDDAAKAPFLWITGGATPLVRGEPSHTVNADAGNAHVSWRWDGRQLLIESDALGLIPAYLYRHGDDVAVSTSIEKLIQTGARLSVDHRALAVFLRLGFFVGDDTPFMEIRAIPPAARVVWQPGQLEWGGAPFVPRRIEISRSDAIDRANELTSAAVAKRVTTEEFAVPLSGGRDSRHILLALAALGRRPTFAVTVPRFAPTAAEDQRIAAAVAATVGVHHVIVSQTTAPAAAEARKNVATDYCADEHAWFLPMIDFVRSRVRIAYEGIGGSQWVPGWLADVESRTLWSAGRTGEVATRMLERYSIVGEPFLRDLLVTDACSRTIAAERLTEELDRHVDAADPGKSFHFWNRLRRVLALVPFGLMRQGGDIYTPLADRHLLEFLLSLPPETVSSTLMREDKSFHSDAIARAFPAAAHLPFESDGAPHTDARLHDRAFSTSVAKYLLRRSARSRLMRRPYVWPRLAKALVSRRYAESTRWLASRSLYLAQVEDALR